MQGRAPPTSAAREKKERAHPSDNTDTGQLWEDFFSPLPKYEECSLGTGVALARFREPLGNLSRGVETGSPAMTPGPRPARHQDDSGLADPAPHGRTVSPVAYLREPGSAGSRRAASVVVERTGGGHIRRVPSPGDGAPGRPRIAALAPRASGHAPQSSASWPVRGAAENSGGTFPPQARSALTPAIQDGGTSTRDEDALRAVRGELALRSTLVSTTCGAGGLTASARALGLGWPLKTGLGDPSLRPGMWPRLRGRGLAVRSCGRHFGVDSVVAV